MIKDDSESISFMCNHIVEYKGDPNRLCRVFLTKARTMRPVLTCGITISFCNFISLKIWWRTQDVGTQKVILLKAPSIPYYCCNGLHQAVEAKEGLPIQSETITLTSVSYQNFFLQLPKLCGMTGTTTTESAKF